MKKINFPPILLLAAALTFVSCEDDLEVVPNKTIALEDFLSNPDNAKQLVTGTYNKNLDYETYAFSWIGVTSITSDDADKGSSPGDNGTDKNLLDELNFVSSGLSFNEVWKSRYGGIGRANKALFYLEQFSIDPAIKSRYIGEVKFLRALWYFDLVRCFGGVPIIITEIDINNEEAVSNTVYVRKTKQETYAQIEADLLDAINRLPLKSEYPLTDLGRATKGAAQALLAKAYLYQEKWQQAFDMSGNVIDSEQYSLLDNYAQVWRQVGENQSESIFEIQATLTNGITDYTNVQGPRGTPDLGWGFNTPSQGLANAYEAGDLRREATIIFVPSILWDGQVAPTTLTNPRYNYKSYHSTIAEDWDQNKTVTAKNVRVLKYSDILLIRAEAAFHIGNTGEALDRINQIRDRAGLDDAVTVSLQSIWKERRLEMAMEHDRWFDLVRTGQAQVAMALDGKTFVTGKHELFPIPQEQISASNGRLIQNPGY